MVVGLLKRVGEGAWGFSHKQSWGPPGTCILLFDVVPREQTLCYESSLMGKPLPAAAQSAREWLQNGWLCRGLYTISKPLVVGP